MSDHIDLSALQGGTVRMRFRIKDASFYTVNAGSKSQFFIDHDWEEVPVFTPGMKCPECGNKITHNSDCDTCFESSRNGVLGCAHGVTVCPECIDEWAMDYYFLVGLVQNGEVTEWFALNEAPGYRPL